MTSSFQTYHVHHKPNGFLTQIPQHQNPLLPFMAPFTIFLLTLLTITTQALTKHTTTLYLSPKTLFSNYNNMLHSFKIFIYPSSPPTTTPFTTTQESLFYTSLLHSPFLTQDPTQAHLFLLPFPSSTSTSSRNLARFIRTIRITFPFWNRTLGADHFFLSASGVDSSSDRNLVELKKNSIQISCFPTSSGFFIPHKDLTLPPMRLTPSFNSVNVTQMYLGYMKLSDVTVQTPFNNLIEEINDDPDFIVKYEAVNREDKSMKNSRFCLFVYGSDMTWIVEAMGSGCVPVVITDRPIQDLPLMDVIDWSEMAVFVGAQGGVKALKQVLDGIEKSRYERMVESGVAAAHHLVWNAEPQAHDAFHMVVYQLWLRRHTIRYARWVEQ